MKCYVCDKPAKHTFHGGVPLCSTCAPASEAIADAWAPTAWDLQRSIDEQARIVAEMRKLNTPAGPVLVSPPVDVAPALAARAERIPFIINGGRATYYDARGETWVERADGVFVNTKTGEPLQVADGDRLLVRSTVRICDT